MKKTFDFRKTFFRFAAFLTAAFLSSPAYAILGQPVPGALGLQESGSPMKDRMHVFYDDLLLPIIIAISVFVLLLLLYIILRFNEKANPKPAKFAHNTLIEIIWTVIPIIIVIVIAIPSVKLLYYVDKTTEAEMTLKAIGNQWYWSYEYPDNGGISFTSNMVKDEDIKPGQVRLLEVDNPVVLPVDTNVKILTTASDVIHSWAAPALGIKLDAVPGRINETWVRIEKEGTFYGQCSQLCGQNHAYMPIEIKAVSKEAFAKWVHEQGGTLPEEQKALEAGKAQEAAESAESKNKKQ